MTQYDEFATAVRAYLSGDRLDRAQRDLAEYYSEETPFSGSHFERMADRGAPNTITARDLVAVSMLGVNIPAHVAIWILGDGAGPISRLLEQVPSEATIREGGEYLAPGGPLDELWALLSTGCWPGPVRANGMGETKKSKLLAAKRPALVPVVDSVVRAALPQVDSHWAAFRHTFDDETMLLASIGLNPRPPEVPPLRAFDVVVWQAHRRRLENKSAEQR